MAHILVEGVDHAAAHGQAVDESLRRAAAEKGRRAAESVPPSERAPNPRDLEALTVFTIAPIAFGADKFVGWLTDWDAYLAPWINDIVPGSAHDAMLVVGVVEIAAGIAVAVAPRFGAYIVAVGLVGIIVNLVTMGEYYDVALRDFGLLVASTRTRTTCDCRSHTGTGLTSPSP
jgi:hypothetical protein